MQGRLEVYHNRQWGTVCDDDFRYSDAKVVCRQLGSSSWTNVQFYKSGDGDGEIWLDDLSCTGSETNISSCGHNGWGNNNCGHDEDVGVWCFGASEGDIRLVDGSSNYGRLEIFHSNAWGTVCDDNFNRTDAKVACRQLNLPTSNAQVINVKDGTGPIWMDEVQCTGRETGMDMCSHEGWGIHDCGHYEDVGIQCHGIKQPLDGDLRLVGGASEREGRLEVFFNEWGTVCNQYFDIKDARVACRQLRLSTYVAEYYTVGNGHTYQPINLDSLQCTGTEMALSQCAHKGWKRHNCSHTNDVGIRCYGKYVVHGNWGLWSPWGSCSSTCSFGNQERQRKCNSPRPSIGGTTCTGFESETQTCKLRKCPVNGNWSIWTSWEDCSMSCGSGQQRRKRICNNPVPANGGDYCTGLQDVVRNCLIKHCPVNGNWGYWASWSSCSSSCGSGTQQRVRSCNNPPPSDGGAYCYGSSTENQNCQITPCPINGNWGMWSSWEQCSTTCGTGTQQRRRFCNNPPPSYGGLKCPGAAVENQICSPDPCPVDGHWSRWTAWVGCSVTCGMGILKRIRYCDDPAPLYDGLDCPGQELDLQQNFLGYCPVNGSWSSWSTWSKCNTTCGGGIRNRTRLCDSPEPAYNGSDCDGDVVERRDCNSFTCVSSVNLRQTSLTLTHGSLTGIVLACVIISVIITTITMLIFQRRRQLENKKYSNDRNMIVLAEHKVIENEQIKPDKCIGDFNTGTECHSYEDIDRSKPNSSAYDDYRSKRTPKENKNVEATRESNLYENLKFY